MPSGDITRVVDDARDFYGRDYWFAYQETQLGHGNIVARARQDLPERCLYWLRTILAYRLPPARVLDLGSGHGGLVLLLRRAGYDASGLELSPWVVAFAREIFGVPMMLGPLEDQQFGPASFDLITTMDVLEHLPDPVGTLRLAAERLREAGVMVVQTPCVPSGISYDDMVASNHPFLPLMRERGHLYLFTQRGLRQLLQSVGLGDVTFLRPIFAAYDMFAVAGRSPSTVAYGDAIARALSTTPDGRLIQALVDLDDRLQGLTQRYEGAEADRVARLEVIERQAPELAAAEADRAARLEVIERLGEELAAAQADRAARLEVIERQGKELGAAQADRAARLEVIERLGEQLTAAEADRAARLEVIERQAQELEIATASDLARGRKIEELREQLAAAETDRAARLEVIERQARELEVATAGQIAQGRNIEELREQLAAAEIDRAARLEVIERGTRELHALSAELNAVHDDLSAAIVLRGRVIRVLRRGLRRAGSNPPSTSRGRKRTT
jgi:SAM-dependent methyltransferase